MRTLLALAAVCTVLAALLFIYLDVSIAARFDGRLWRLPSRVWSDSVELTPGAPFPAAAFVRRLERSGYASVAKRPAKPGQYRRQGGQVEAYLRTFETPFAGASKGRVRIDFAGGRIVAIRDDRGRALSSRLLEPELLATLYGARQEERRLVRLDEVPPDFVRAVLAAEDSRFFSHGGLDAKGIARAAFSNLRHGGIVQGGSTITQQTVKNLYLHHRRSWWRKIRESLMSLVLERRYSKERILEVYLNEVYLGQRGPVAICGVQAAARFYFGRDLQQLTLGESALLAGMIRSPGRYNPFTSPERARARRDQVLLAMERLEFAGPERLEAARGEALQLASGAGGYGGAPWVLDYVRRELADRYTEGIFDEDGLEVHTTVDTRLQESAERALRGGLEALERGGSRAPGELEGAVVVTHPRSGHVLALVGGRDYSTSQFNRALSARRQPGSCFKPFVYAAAFERRLAAPAEGLTPATLLADEPLELVTDGKSWRPSNYDRQFRGPVSARRALAESLNVPTVRAAQRVGLSRVRATARDCGIGSRMSKVPSLALGTEEVTPLELASAYGTFSRGGARVEPGIVRGVVRRDGQRPGVRTPRARQVISPQTAYLVTDVLQGVFAEGTARSAEALGFRGTAAGKTGTTDDTRDAWFVGYTPEILALVWVGRDDGARTGLTGASGALPIWVDLMRRVGRSRDAQRFSEPSGIRRVRIDPESGKLTVRACPTEREELFAAGSQPTGKCDLHGGRLKRWFRRWRDRERVPKVKPGDAG